MTQPARAFAEPQPVVLVLPYPISANRYWATRCIRNKKTGQYMAMTYVTAEAKQYKLDVGKRARMAGVTKPFLGRVHAHIQLYPHRPLDWQARARKFGPHWDDTVQCIDLGNCEKVLSDALQGIVFDDDKWIWRQTKERMEPDEHGARLVVTITPLVTDSVQGRLL